MQVDPFVATPTCDVVYSHSVSPATSVVSFDSNTRILNFYELSDLTHTDTTGPNYFTDYTVTVTAESGGMTQADTFQLKVKNPCVDTTLSSISSPSDQTVTYKIAQAASTVDIGALAFT